MDPIIITEMEPREGIALKTRFDREKESHCLVMEGNTPFFLLTTSSDSKYLDIDSAKSDGYGVYRVLKAPASKYSVIALGDEYLVMNIKLKGEDDQGTELLKLVRDVLRDQGFDCVIDQNSIQNNDLVVKGRKVAGYAGVAEGGDYYFSCFISLKLKPEMFKYLDLPGVKVEEKGLESVKERVAGLRDFGQDLHKERLKQELAQKVKERYQSHEFDQRELRSGEIEGLDDIAQEIESPAVVRGSGP